MNKKSLLIVSSLYGIFLCISIISYLYATGENERITSDIIEEESFQEGERSFIESDAYRFVEELANHHLEIEDAYQVIIGQLTTEPLQVIYSHQESGTIHLRLRGSVIDLVKWGTKLSQTYPSLEMRIVKIRKDQGSVIMECEIS